MLIWILFLIMNVKAVTLKEAFEASRKNMETLKRADANVAQREEQKNRARAAVLPTIAGVGNYTRIDAPEASGVSNAFTLTKQYSAALRLTQPLIRGGVVGAFQLARENILLAEFQKDASAVNLYQLVINSYFSLKAAELDLKNIDELLKASQDRVKEIRGRAKIGRSRRGELIEAEAQLHAAESQQFQSLYQKEQAERVFEFYTGMKAPVLPELSTVAQIDESLDAQLMKLRNRPDIRANQQSIQVAEKQVSVSKGGHYPTVDFVTNYYIDRTGVLATSEWDAALVFNVPLFQGGGVAAEVREAVEQKRVAELNAHEAIRAAERDLAVLYRNYNQMVAQLETLNKALAKSEEAYRLNKKDYQYGIVTNLDVLQSLNFYVQTKRSRDNLLVTAHEARASLGASTGVLP